MGLPSRKDIKLTWYWKDVMDHPYSERLQMPLFRTMKTQLSVETVGCDVGVGLTPSNLAIQPKIDEFELVFPRTPWPATLRWLAVDHMADTALASK